MDPVHKFAKTFYEEILSRGAAYRACQEILSRDLTQRSCKHLPNNMVCAGPDPLKSSCAGPGKISLRVIIVEHAPYRSSTMKLYMAVVIK